MRKWAVGPSILLMFLQCLLGLARRRLLSSFFYKLAPLRDAVKDQKISLLMVGMTD